MICQTCGGRGYEGGSITAEDVCVTNTCPTCKGKCETCGEFPVYAQSQCKRCFYAGGLR